MKLVHILPLFEGYALTPAEMEVPYQYIRRHELNTVEDLDEFVENAQARYPRSPGSLKFLAARMNIFIHGYVPQGLAPNSWKTMFANSENKKIRNYILDQGEFSEADLFDLQKVANQTHKHYDSLRSQADGDTKGRQAAQNLIERLYKEAPGNLKKVLPKQKFEEIKWDMIERVMAGWTVTRTYKYYVPEFEEKRRDYDDRDQNDEKVKRVDDMLGKYIKQHSPRWLNEMKLRKVRNKLLRMDKITNRDVSEVMDLARRRRL